MTFGSKELVRVRPPARVEELGIPVGLAEDLFMRRVLTDRVTSIGEVAQALHILHPVADELASALREKRHIEYLGANGRDYRIQLTEHGHKTTNQRMAGGQHVGGVPVPLVDYQRIVKAQRSDIRLDRQTMQEAFDDLVLDDDLLDQIGPAFVGDGAMFLYGPAGTGKTSIAERLNRIFDEPVLVPRHIETDGQIISVYDPALHLAVTPQPDELDPRWVLCERPLVVVGGELDMTMLDLQHDRVSGVNIAPIQLLANNGILVVDDFGRQAIRPEAILNRWIVPLSRGVDYLKAGSGVKFTVPFELKLVISTNLEPTSLGDDAFLRRLRNKVFIGPVDEAAFVSILKQSAATMGVQLSTGTETYLCDITRDRVGALRPYVAADFCELTEATCRYEGLSPVLDTEMVDRIAELYFVHKSAETQPIPNAIPVEQRPTNGGQRPDLQVPGEWSQYEIGGGYCEDPMAGLEALASTQSVDGLPPVDGVPAALRAAGPAQH